MDRLPRIAPWVVVGLAAALCVAVCHERLIPTVPTVYAAVAAAQDQPPPPPDQTQGQAQDQGQDPAAVNMAPSGPSYTTEVPPQQQGQYGAPGQAPDDSGYAEQPTETATEAPPPLPDYDQPPAPADGYIWTPGYWAWGPQGYYWVPGAWVEPPYTGALWTPGYWGFYGGSYGFYPGRWGMHIGFYGGINYGFGYVGLGYEGGYWNGTRFFYNRSYNRLNTRVVRNVYSYNAGNRGSFGGNRGGYDAGNRGGTNTGGRSAYDAGSRGGTTGRPSFNGGERGVQARPQGAEAAAAREPYAPRMSTQVQHAQSYASDRGQLASQNHGRPATPAVNRPVLADRNVRPTASRGGGQARGNPR
jgi:hypothetical protein